MSHQFFSDISVRVVCPCSSSDCSSSRVILRWWIGYVNIVIMHDNTQHVVWLMLKNNEEATCSVTMPYRLPDDGVETSCLRARSNKIWVGRLAFLNSGWVKLRRPSADMLFRDPGSTCIIFWLTAGLLVVLLSYQTLIPQMYINHLLLWL